MFLTICFLSACGLDYFRAFSASALSSYELYLILELAKYVVLAVNMFVGLDLVDDHDVVASVILLSTYMHL